jgi:uncharacterized protein (TIGR03435 family)
MLRSLLSERFHLKVRSETHKMRVYELLVAQGGPRIHPVQPEDAVAAEPGIHFRSNMRQFADYLAAQISVPVPAGPQRAGNCQ